MNFERNLENIEDNCQLSNDKHRVRLNTNILLFLCADRQSLFMFLKNIHHAQVPTAYRPSISVSSYATSRERQLQLQQDIMALNSRWRSMILICFVSFKSCLHCERVQAPFFWWNRFLQAPFSSDWPRECLFYNKRYLFWRYNQWMGGRNFNLALICSNPSNSRMQLTWIKK